MHYLDNVKYDFFANIYYACFDYFQSSSGDPITYLGYGFNYVLSQDY
jgi:hypothetical protein